MKVLSLMSLFRLIFLSGLMSIMLGSNNERIVFANRGGGDIVLIEEGIESSQIRIKLLDNSEPMYVRNTRLTEEIWIGDRGNNKLIVYDTIRYRMQGIYEGCNGIFHQGYNFINQLWIVCDIDKSILVMDVEKKQKLTQIQIRHIGGFKPHDIWATNSYTFVTLLGNTPNTNSIGFVVQYDTEKFKEIRRVQVGNDPHVFANNDNVYIASQTKSLLYKFDIHTLTLIDTLKINGAHGIFGNIGGEYLWVTDMSSIDGRDSIHAIDLNTFTFICGSPFDSSLKEPHNVRSNDDATKLFITHTTSDAVTAYDLIDGKPKNGRVIFHDEGSKPFGIMNTIDGACNAV